MSNSKILYLVPEQVFPVCEIVVPGYYARWLVVMLVVSSLPLTTSQLQHIMTT